MSFLTAPPKKAGGNSCRAAFSVNHGTDSGKNGNKHCRKINRGVIDPEADTRLSRSLCPVVDDFLREPVCRIGRQVFDKYLPQTGSGIQLPVFKPGKIGAVAERDDIFTDGAVNNQIFAEIVP